MGCAFAACLERKQKREKECGVTATFDASRTTFTREGSFRVTTATEQAEREEIMKQIQDAKKGTICSTTMCVYLNSFSQQVSIWKLSEANFFSQGELLAIYEDLKNKAKNLNRVLSFRVACLVASKCLLFPLC